MSTTRPGNQLRGWNDPPEILHNPADTTNVLNSHRTILNKRVSHNLLTDNSGANGIATDSTPTVLPPTIPQMPPGMFYVPTTSEPVNATEELVHHNVVPESNHTAASDQLEISLDYILNVFNQKLEYLKSNSVTNKTIDDILKRIKIFSTNWDKLSAIVKENMFHLAMALNNGELSRADDIHLKLVLDYSSEVIQWMVGIKKLIYEMKSFHDTAAAN